MEKFYIVAKDSELYKDYFRWKENSKINKAWVKSLEDKEIKVRRKPMLAFYFTIYGRHRTRLFAIGDELYCSIRSEYDYEKPEWAKEIRASEFWKTVEDYETKNA